MSIRALCTSSPALALVAMLWTPASLLAQDTCVADSIEISGAQADTTVLVYFGRGQGQIIDVADTLVRSVTVWRTPQPAVFELPLQVFVSRVNENGQPVAHDLILEGPQLPNTTGDGVHPVEIVFVLEPPLQLPGPGKYFFAIKEAKCLGVLSLLADSADPYSPGGVWQTFPSFDCYQLGGGLGVQFQPTFDLAIRVAFCPGSTHSRARSWGALKAIYR